PKRLAVRTKGGTCGEQQTLGLAALDAIEVTEFGDGLAGGIHDHDLISLIGCRPDVIAAVDCDTIAAVDAICEHHRRSWRFPDDGNLDDQIERCVAHKHVPFTVEFDSIRTEGWNTFGWLTIVWQKGDVSYPSRCWLLCPAALRTTLLRRVTPDDALE